MFETYLISNKFGEFITLTTNGHFLISKVLTVDFLMTLTHDIEMAKAIKSFKDNYNITEKKIKVNAKELFYIMKHANQFGIKDIDHGIHLFKFVSDVRKKDINVNINSDAETVLFEITENISLKATSLQDNFQLIL